jgi:uncharacterized membrane protein
MAHITLLELITVTISLLVALIYHFHLFCKVRRSPLTTAIGIMNDSRRQWVESVILKERDILAIQTMRNWVMAATFLASTSILISLGLISAALRPGVINEITTSLNFIGSVNEALFTVKLLVLLFLFFISFFNFTIAIRYYNHAGVTINIAANNKEGLEAEKITQTLNAGALHYTIGVRCFYLAIPTSMWLFGPLWMLVSSLILFFVLCRLDCST